VGPHWSNNDRYNFIYKFDLIPRKRRKLVLLIVIHWWHHKHAVLTRWRNFLHGGLHVGVFSITEKPAKEGQKAWQDRFCLGLAKNTRVYCVNFLISNRILAIFTFIYLFFKIRDFDFNLSKANTGIQKIQLHHLKLSNMQRRHVANRKFLRVQGKLWRGKTFCLLWWEWRNKMFVPVLYSYTYNNKQARTVYYKFIMKRNMKFVCLFHLYPPVTRKRRRRYILDESAPA